MLVEHFRCTRAIIRFCNDRFYEGRLQPLRVSTRAQRLVPQIRCNADRAGRGLGEDDPGPSAEEVEARLSDMAGELMGHRNDALKDMCRVSAWRSCVCVRAPAFSRV